MKPGRLRRSWGLATKIMVDPLFGTATTTIPIELPPGRKGMTPDLTVRYSSNAGNGIFGLGWDLQLGCIKRDTSHGIPFDYANSALTYDNAKGFVLMFHGGTVVLDTPLAATGGCTSPWGASSEEVWLSACFDQTGNQWTITDKNGVASTYGAAVNARTGIDTSNSAANKTFEWYLTHVEDPNGNAIDVSYVAPAPWHGHVYPVRVDYGVNSVAGYAHMFHAVFDIGTPRPDVTTNYRGGFAEDLAFRVQTITVSVDGVATPTRIYTFGYTQDAETGLSLLTGVSEALASPTAPPPSTTFSYQASTHGLGVMHDLSFDRVDLITTPKSVTGAIPIGTVRGFLDIDGDGLTDFLDGYRQTALQLHRNQGNGSFTYAGAWTALTLDYVDSMISGPDSSLLDMDGDGLPDVMQIPDSCTTAPCSWLRYANSGGTLASDPTSWSGAPAFFPNPTPSDASCLGDSQLLDLNGDGRPDILDCDGVCPSPGQPAACLFRRNTGSGFASGTPWSVPAANDAGTTANPLRALRAPYPSDSSVKDTVKQLLDLNGDGLPDLVSSQPASGTGHWDVWFNTGRGFDSVVSWPAPPFGSTDPPYAIEMQGLPAAGLGVTRALRDMNGDGLPDYVDASTTPWSVYLNTGVGFSGSVPWPGATAPYISQSLNGVQSDVLDLNGDGMADYVQTTGAAGTFLSAQWGGAPRGGLLVQHENGLGASCALTYVVSTDPATAGSGCAGGVNAAAPCVSNADCPASTCSSPCLDCSQLPFPTWVVRTLTEHSGFSADVTTQYTFTGGYFDPVGHQFRGFRQSIAKRLADGRTLRRQFAPPPFAISGDPLWAPSPLPFKLVDEQVLDDQGKPLTETMVDWDLIHVLAGSRWQVHPSQRIDTTYSTASGDTTTQTRTQRFTVYDVYNNLTTEIVTASGVANAMTTTTQYAAAGSCHGQPTQITVKDDTARLSVREFTYDSRCNLTASKARIAPSGADPINGTLTTLTSVEYDQSSTSPDQAAGKAGQPTRVLDARGSAASPRYGTALSYACSSGLYPCTITNALSQIVVKTYDLQSGKPLSVSDPNDSSIHTTFTYDGLGRLTSIIRPLDSLAFRAFTYVFGAAPSDPSGTPVPTRIETQLREPSQDDGFRLSVAFYDSVGRALQTKEETSVNGNAQVVVRDTATFDAEGRVAARAAAFIAARSITEWDDSIPATAGTTSFQYDVLDRTTQTANPDGTVRSTDYSVAGRTLTSDENATAAGSGGISGSGRRVVELHDGLGRVIDTSAYDGDVAVAANLTARTGHVYDALNRVAKTTRYSTPTASGDNITTVQFFYDSLSRRTSLNDPDSGVWSYKYDKTSNLTFQNDPAANQHLEFCYDKLNRVRCTLSKTGDAYSGTGCPTSDTAACGTNTLAQYAYDATPSGSVFTCDNGKGRLCRVDDTSGNTSFAYDARGRVTQSQKAITATVGATIYSKTFTFSQTYDEADRLSTVKYPTDTYFEYLTYEYDFGGHLTQATTVGNTYLALAFYDRFGRPTQHVYGSDSIATTWTYADGASGPASQFRLQQIKVAGGADVYQQFDYGPYDQAGNLLGVADTTPGYADTNERSNDWSYTYDGVGRLQNATPQATGWGGAATFGYDTNGFMTRRGDLNMSPDPAKPDHIASSTPGAAAPAYPYDANGALSSRPDTDASGADVGISSVTYDKQGRVDTVTMVSGSTIQSVYDYSGARVARIVNGTPTFYFGRLFEVTSNRLTRHIYADTRRIAQSTVTLAAGNPLLASLRPDDRQDRVQLADALRWSPQLYPGYVLTGESAAQLGALVLLTLIILDRTPGRVRLSFTRRRGAPFRNLRRGHVLVLIGLFSLSLTPLTCVRPVRATCTANCGGGGPPPPTFALYFVHTDHLGSTTLLTCDRQAGTCPGRQPAAYFRYDAYGMVKAWDKDGNAVAIGSEKTDLLYTGQRWDAQARLHYYGARFYDPRIANFLSEDPAREYMNPYAYVGWNPVQFTDPTGMFNFTTFMLELHTLGEYAAAYYAAGTGGFAQGGSFQSGSSANGSGGSASTTIAGGLAAHATAQALAAVAAAIQNLAETQGGGVQTVASPVFASTVNDAPGSASAAASSSAGLMPQSFGIAVSSSVAAGAYAAGGAADINALMGYFPGSDPGAGGSGYGEATSYGLFANLASLAMGAPSDQANSSATGASLTPFSFGPFFSNVASAHQLMGTFQSTQITLGPVTLQVDTAGSNYVVSILLGMGGPPGASVVSLTTFTPAGSVSGRY